MKVLSHIKFKTTNTIKVYFSGWGEGGLFRLKRASVVKLKVKCHFLNIFIIFVLTNSFNITLAKTIKDILV